MSDDLDEIIAKFPALQRSRIERVLEIIVTKTKKREQYSQASVACYVSGVHEVLHDMSDGIMESTIRDPIANLFGVQKVKQPSSGNLIVFENEEERAYGVLLYKQGILFYQRKGPAFTFMPKDVAVEIYQDGKFTIYEKVPKPRGIVPDSLGAKTHIIPDHIARERIIPDKVTKTSQQGLYRHKWR